MFYLKFLLFAQMNEIDILPDDVTDVKEFYDRKGNKK